MIWGLPDPHFSSGGGGFVNRVEDLLHGEGLGGEHVGLGLAEQAIDEVDHAIRIHQIDIRNEVFDYIPLGRGAEEFEWRQLQTGFSAEQSCAVEPIVFGVFGP